MTGEPEELMCRTEAALPRSSLMGFNGVKTTQKVVVQKHAVL